MGLGQHLVRIGVHGQVGRFDAADNWRHPRGTRVVCRTERGLEVGEVLGGLRLPAGASDGQLLRRVTPDDQLLIERIEQRRDRAFQACARRLQERNLPAVLVDVEHLFDGQSLYFYFLGTVTPEVEALTGELAEIYEANVRFRRFSETLAQGCGPDCGTKESGCSDGSCSSCALAGACGTTRTAE